VSQRRHALAWHPGRHSRWAGVWEAHTVPSRRDRRFGQTCLCYCVPSLGIGRQVTLAGRSCMYVRIYRVWSGQLLHDEYTWRLARLDHPSPPRHYQHYLLHLSPSKMAVLKLALLIIAAHLAAAHFSIEYPSWRADTLAANTTYSQWIYPCTPSLFFRTSPAANFLSPTTSNFIPPSSFTQLPPIQTSPSQPCNPS
jgi:hypothetical protein